MSNLWIEKTPPYIVCINKGYLDVTFTQKIGSVGRAVKTNVTFQVVTAPGLPLGSKQIDFGPDKVQLIKVENTHGKPGALITERAPEGYPDTGQPLVIIGQQALSSWLSRNLVGPMIACQTRLVVYKKITVRLFYSKESALILGPGNLESVRNYETYHLTCDPSLCGGLDSGALPAVGAITINQYPGSLAESTMNKVERRQSDKPGRFFIRGAAISPEDALRGKEVGILQENLTIGAPFVENLNVQLVPVIDILGDMWHVRASQSGGYVRVSSQRNVQPTKKLDMEGLNV